MPGKTWTRKMLATLLDEKDLPDAAVREAAPFTQMDLERMSETERETVLAAFREAAVAARGTHGGPVMPQDVRAGLRAARAALEAVPQDERSNRAVRLLADCACTPAVPADS